MHSTSEQRGLHVFLTRRDPVGRGESVAWFVGGVALALLLVWVQVGAVGGPSGLLTVGEDASLRPFIERHLGEVETGLPHDGQFAVAIAHDLTGDTVPDLIPDPGYRYRRILLPALASVGGLVEGRAVMWSLIGISILATGMTLLATAHISALVGAPRWSLAGVVVNPGVYLTLWITTADALGLALALLGVWLSLSRRWTWAAVALTAAVLAKEQFLLVALGLAMWEASRRRWRPALLIAGIPGAALAAWSLILEATMGAGVSPRGNLALPFVGVVESATTIWPDAPASDVALALFTVVVTVVAAIVSPRLANVPLPWLEWPWVVMAAVSSSWVWDFGNNTARVFAIVGIFAGLSLGVWWSEQARPSRPGGRLSVGGR